MNRRIRKPAGLALAALALLSPALGRLAARAQTTSPLFPVGLEVPAAPSAFRAGGKTHVVYELHVNSFRAGELNLNKVEVLDGGAGVLASYQDAALNALLGRPGAGAQLTDKRVIGPGMRAVLFLWLTFETPDAVPGALRHRLFFKIPGSEAERVVEGGQVAVGRAAPFVIGPPVRGKGWVARFVSNTSFHRRGLLVVNGRAAISQRFAIDWGKFGDDSKALRPGTDGSKNSDFYIYGEEVIAVGDATVAGTRSDIPENDPRTATPAVPVSLDTAAGNFVVLDLGRGHYALYAHLQPGSVRVKTGERVRRGQVLGLIGNSGNAVGPHLHFQLADAGVPLAGEGLPYVFDSFEVQGTETPEEFQKGEWTPKAGAKAERRRMEFPSDSAVINFR